MTRLLLALAVLAATWLVSCAAPAPEPPALETADGAPIRRVAPEDVPDAVPRPDPLLAAGNRSPYTVNGVTYEVMPSPQGYEEEGIASWYGTKFHGRKTSNGEIFDLYGATAAHRTLPIPSYARVTNLANGRSITVRVNDRGPFHPDRLIDLSYGAAVKLGFMERGTAPVRERRLDVTGVDDRRDAPGGHYRYLQLGAFGSEVSAERLKGELERLISSPVFISPVAIDGGLLYRVRVGPVADARELAAVQARLQASGHGSGQPLP